jgi:hypothetical protein
MNNTAPRWLALVVVLQLLVLVGQWTGPHYGTPAHAQLTDPATQRNNLIDQQRLTNEKLDRLIAIFESGNLQVRTASADDTSKTGK